MSTQVVPSEIVCQCIELYHHHPHHPCSQPERLKLLLILLLIGDARGGVSIDWPRGVTGDNVARGAQLIGNTRDRKKKKTFQLVA
uniref:Uncharacterized protein n=1 Tax=Oryza punctata TaxID=4537 RepID=A0A0E0MLH6_ORYPU